MPVYKLQITANGENGEQIETTIEKEAESKELAIENYQERVDEIVEYWDITIERATERQSST